LAGQRELYPAEALDLLENLGLCLGKLKEANDFQKRIAGIDQDMARYEVTVAEVAEKIAPDLTGQAAEQVVVQLKARLNQARDDRTLLADCRRGIAETEEELLLLAGERESVEKQLQDLCRQAGCQHPAELEGAEELSRQYRELQARLQETETMLIRGAGGLDLDRLEEEARHCDDPDALPGQIAGLARELDEVLAPESRRLSELIGEKKTRLDQMDGSARAARAAEEAALAQARLKRLCDRYLKLKLAAHTLKGEIERYRAANQDPVIGLASRYFQAMTLGAYRGLRTDENERGEPILVGVRGENQRVEVGRMSDGTRDQLYLALRLASLVWRRKSQEPMPFIVDDILINFDDARSRATLAILAELAAGQQVILFTHHRRIADEALVLADPERVRLHQLNDAGAQEFS